MEDDADEEPPLRELRPVLKRTRHACDPCRRKKSKCSGDRPSCSTCARLRQRCAYPPEADSDADLPDETVAGSEARRSLPPPVTPTTGSRSHSHGGGGGGGSGSTHGQQQHLESRLHSLESTISHVLDTLHSVSAAGTLHSLSAEVLHSQASLPTPRGVRRTADAGDGLESHGSSRKRIRTDESPPLWKQVEAVGSQYLKYCEGQPLYLFHRETFVRSLRFRPDELLLAILALTLRFKDATATPGTTSSASTHGHATEEYGPQDSLTLASKAHALVMAKIGTRAIELSTLQTLCLLAFVHFHDGNPDQSMPFVTLSMALTYGLFLHAETPSVPASVIEERRRTYWSIRLLCRLWGMAPSAFDLPGSQSLTSPYPTTPSLPPMSALKPECRTLYGPSRGESVGERGIMAYTYQLGEVWSQAMIFVRQRFAAASSSSSFSSSSTHHHHHHSSHHQQPPTTHIAPWETTSQYNAIMSAFMGFDRSLPPLHRYRHLHLGDLTTLQLNESQRDYWAPWLLSRFMYHTIIIVANHPLLVTLQLQGKGNDSELFRQQAQFYTAVHTSWIMHFVTFIESKGYELADPTMGYCAGVVATVELQLSFAAPPPANNSGGSGVGNAGGNGASGHGGRGGGGGDAGSSGAAGKERRRNFEKCLRFVRALGKRWPSMEVLAKKLDALTESISMSFESMAQLDTGGNIHVDISKVSDILDYAAGAARTPLLHGPHHGGSAADGSSGSAMGAGEVAGDKGRQQWTTLVQPPSVDQPDHASAVDFSALLLSAAAGADGGSEVGVAGDGFGGGGGFDQSLFGTGVMGHHHQQQQQHHRQSGGGFHPAGINGNGAGMMMLGGTVDGLMFSGNNAGTIPADMFFGMGGGQEETASWGAFGGF
ncbi:uncharacterized protein B0I36DRAFT_415910 [Microdochium trichocladiopsis]|uniref:Zn(2)-C6 fungal-type domain-containing protein n=1 Tax=Microdochium trichocladiopsis TaxID=1682393 RepID=A0A9P9BLK9_9PEZI|nr:uncharacterized protein B0I36DRAFT_415910 [Microdochium trichocladiopsis]KAH7024505.1 hypothetical protein B0I36DRAFT_415910 [Microdochium trichocladiopsis]